MQPAPLNRRPPRRAAARKARHARRRALLAAVGVGILVVLAVAAFRPSGHPAVGDASPGERDPPSAAAAAQRRDHRRLRQAPRRLAGERARRHRDRLPRSRRRCAGVRARSAGRRTRASPPVSSTGSSAEAAAASPTTCSAEARARPPERSTSARRPAPTCTRPPTAPWSGLRDYVLNGRKYGSVIDIQPADEPSVVLSVSHVQADPALTVGSHDRGEHLEDRLGDRPLVGRAARPGPVHPGRGELRRDRAPPAGSVPLR